jgi:hypothetical protein
LPSKEVITLSLSTPDVILTGINRIRKWSWISQGVGPLDTVFRKRPEWPTVVKKMSITPPIHSLIDLLEHPLTLETILRLSRVSNFETCKLLWAFLIIGIIEKTEAAFLIPAPQFGRQPDAPSNDDTRVFERNEPLGTSIQSQPPVSLGAHRTTVDVNDSTVSFLDSESAAEPPPPVVDISFSDLADLTDEGESSQSVELMHAVISKREQELERNIRNFNEVHRYIYETVRIEIGSTVHQFLAKIHKKIFGQFPLVFVGVQMNEFGELDKRALIANIQANLAEQYPVALESVIQEEKNALRSFLDSRKVEAIEAGIARIIEKHNTTIS